MLAFTRKSSFRGFLLVVQDFVHPQYFIAVPLCNLDPLGKVVFGHIRAHPAQNAYVQIVVHSQSTSKCSDAALDLASSKMAILARNTAGSKFADSGEPQKLLAGLGLRLPRVAQLL